jgi:uncharacterized protein YndB with AHSA1/START domain
MNDYRQTLVVKAVPAKVYAALTKAEGLRAWWTQDCDVAIEVGHTIRFRFGLNHKDMSIELLDPGREVRWLCTGAHIDQLAQQDEWVGTHLVFRLSPEGETHTRLAFEHLGLVPGLECYDLCISCWRYYLDSLQQFIETGRGAPYELSAAVAS